MNKKEVVKPIGQNQTGIQLEAPYGKFHVGGELSLLDHAAMRADQLSAMLLLIHGEGLNYFSDLEDNARQSYLWLTHQLASELVQILPSLTVREGGAA